MEALYDRAKASIVSLLKKKGVDSVELGTDEDGNVPGDEDYDDSSVDEIYTDDGVLVTKASIDKDGNLELSGEDDGGEEVNDEHIKKTIELMASVLGVVENILSE